MTSISAFFNVYKPKGPTSHDVVARLRRASGVRRIGHAGTLDPLAEGVLVVAVGQATRLIEYLVGADKVYRADVTLGVETETYDAEGRVVAERPAEAQALERVTVERALEGFRGTIDQRPPPFSAVSVGGQRLYALARRGQRVEAPLRRVTIARLELQAWRTPVVELEVACSKGTYIRSLAHDLGQALGCGAHLSALVRLRSGTFRAQDATPLDALETRLREGSWDAVASPLDVAVAHLPHVSLDASEVARLALGRTVPVSTVPVSGEGAAPWGTLGGAYGPGGELVAVVRLDRAAGGPVWRPEKVLAGPDGRPTGE